MRRRLGDGIRIHSAKASLFAGIDRSQCGGRERGQFRIETEQIFFEAISQAGKESIGVKVATRGFESTIALVPRSEEGGEWIRSRIVTGFGQAKQIAMKLAERGTTAIRRCFSGHTIGFRRPKHLRNDGNKTRSRRVGNYDPVKRSCEVTAQLRSISGGDRLGQWTIAQCARRMCSRSMPEGVPELG